MIRAAISLLFSLVLGLTPGPAFAQTKSDSFYPSDPFAKGEASLARAARDPLGEPHLRHAFDSKRELGLSESDGFALINASADALGGSHARLQQLYQGVKVRGGELISHLDARGAFQPFTDSALRGISISTTPRVSSREAEAAVERLPSHLYPYSWIPRTELVIEPSYERVLSRTGRPLAPTECDPPDPDSVFDATDATDVVRRVSGYRLVWRIRTIEGREGYDEPINEMEYEVDAQTGEVVQERELAWSITGTGFGQFNTNVQLNTLPGVNGFQLIDAARNFSTWDNDFAKNQSPNVDTNNVWGDGKAFTGDLTASKANRQSAMVDGHFGAAVYWDLLSNVFGRKGPDGSSLAVDVYAHVGAGLMPQMFWNNAQYSPSTEDILLGDGLNYQALDVLGHEEAHGLNNHTAGLHGSTGRGINESNSDIFGALTTFYLGGLGFANGLTDIPNAGGTWVGLNGKGRNLQKPTLGSGKDKSDAWYSGLDSVPDEHDVGQPNNRAFYFLSQGASPFMKADSYSPKLPWGMTGLGNDEAGRIWFEALTHRMSSDPDYPKVRGAVIEAAMFTPVANIPQALAAVANAYAGINVGPKAANYPAEPSAIGSPGTNTTWQTAKDITLPNIPIGASVPGKVKVVGAGSTKQWFTISLPAGASATLRVNSNVPSDDWDLYVYDILDPSTVIDHSAKAKGKYDLVDEKATSGLDGQGQILLVEVRPYHLEYGAGSFTLDIDRY